MSTTPADLRARLTRATQTHADLLDLRARLCGVDNAFSELAAHPEDEATIRAARAHVATAADSALDQIDALLAREAARIEALVPVVAALDAEEDRLEREEQASEGVPA